MYNALVPDVWNRGKQGVGDDVILLFYTEPPPPQTVSSSPSISPTECLPTLPITTTTVSSAVDAIPVSTPPLVTSASHILVVKSSSVASVMTNNLVTETPEPTPSPSGLSALTV